MTLAASPLRLQELPRITDVEWDHGVDRCENGTMFHHSAWLSVVEKGLGIELVKMGLFKGNDLVGLFPFFERKICGFRIAGSPLYVETMPVLGPIGSYDVDEFVNTARQFMRDKRIRYMRIFFNHLVERHCNPTEYVRFHEKTTHVNRLTVSKDELWNNVKMQCKNKIRKGEKNNLKIIFDDDLSNLQEYLLLVKKLYADQGVCSPKPSKLYEQMSVANKEKKIVKVMFAAHEGKIIGGLILALNNKTANLIDSAILSEYKKLQAGNFLSWNAMEWCMRNGFEYFDFTGSDIERISEFKASFGGELKRYSCVEIANPKLIFKAREAYGRNRPRFQQVAYSVGKISAAIMASLRLPLYMLNPQSIKRQ